MMVSAKRSRTNDLSLLNYHELEYRMVRAAIAFDSGTGIISVTGNATDEDVALTNWDASTIRVQATLAADLFVARNQVTRLNAQLGAGHDFFENATNVAAYVFGNAGDDVLIGGSGNDELNGGDGMDEIAGGAGDDRLLGGNEDDVLSGNEGNDVLIGYFGDDMLIGDAGNDLLYGQYGNDSISGDAGTDRIRGSWGDDWLDGGSENDALFGDQDHDEIHGGLNNDVIYGYEGDDQIYGDGGDDQLYGMDGSDYLSGGDGQDILRGGNGNDELHGDAGVDRMFGEAGDDALRGGSGSDVIRGGDDNDSLFGGTATDNDFLYGELGADRFLTQSNDSIGDMDINDAQLRFVNVTSNWTDAEIEVLDQSFSSLFQATGNNVLLRDSLDTNALGFYKYADLNGAAGINQLSMSGHQEFINGQWQWVYTYTREIRILDWDETSDWNNNAFRGVALHEIGHSWDSELELSSISADMSVLWNSYEAESGWRDTNPNDAVNYRQSLDGQWWYLQSATFAENYGRTNPNEDWSTAWELFFDSTADPALKAAMQDKLAIVTTFLAGCS